MEHSCDERTMKCTQRLILYVNLYISEEGAFDMRRSSLWKNAWALFLNLFLPSPHHIVCHRAEPPGPKLLT